MSYAYQPQITPVIPVPAVRGHFGHRLSCFSTTLSVHELRDLIGSDPRSSSWKELPEDLREMYEDVQRQTKGQRIAGLKRYINERFVDPDGVAGGFPAISIAFTNWSRFEPLEQSPNMGFLHISTGKQNRGMVIDGLGRVSAAFALLDEIDSGDSVRKRRAEAQIESFRFSCTIFAPKEMGQMLQVADLQQLFHDFNFLASPISKAHAIAIDHSDVYISMTKFLAQQDVIKNNGGMKEGKPATRRKPSRKKTDAPALPPIVTQSTLLMFVRAALEGEEWGRRNAREKPESPNAKASKIEEHGTDIAEFLTDFAEAMGDDFLDKKQLHLTAKGWFTLGAIYHDLVYTLKAPGVQDAIAALARVDWRATNPIWEGIVDIVPITKPTQNGYKFATTGFIPHQEMLRVVRRELKIDQLLIERAETA